MLIEALRLKTGSSCETKILPDTIPLALGLSLNANRLMSFTLTGVWQWIQP